MEKAKPTILFLHGALGTKEDVLPLMELIQERGFSTYSFNFSGHGVSKTWPVEFRIDLFARDLEKFIHDHNLKDLVVFGYSMGGYVALYHMANYEDSPISHLFTYGTKFNWSEKAVSSELPMLNPENLEKNFPQQVEILKKKHGDRWKSLLQSTAHMMQNQERLDGLTRQDMEDITIPVTL